jgi:hypothetical protein
VLSICVLPNLYVFNIWHSYGMALSSNSLKPFLCRHLLNWIISNCWSSWSSYMHTQLKLYKWVINISLKMVILDTLKWAAMAWWVIPAWTIPTPRSRSFWLCRDIDVLAKIQISRMANCLLLLTAQLMTAGDLNA